MTSTALSTEISRTPRPTAKSLYHILTIWMHSYLKVLDSADSSWRVSLVTRLHGVLDGSTALPAIAELRARHRRSGLFAFFSLTQGCFFSFFTARICIADMENLYHALFAALSGRPLPVQSSHAACVMLCARMRAQALDRRCCFIFEKGRNGCYEASAVLCCDCFSFPNYQACVAPMGRELGQRHAARV